MPARRLDLQAGFPIIVAAIAVGVALVMATTWPDRTPGSGDHLPGTRFKDPFVSGSGTGPEMTVLPSGSIVVGSGGGPGRLDESPRHTVNIDYRLAVSTHETTWDEYSLCVEDGACSGYVPDDNDWGMGQRPVVNVSFNDVYVFIRWLNARLGIAHDSADRYTLPSEAEWEYAAMSGMQGSTLAPYGFGETLTARDANFERDRTTLVGAYPANPWGLHDMHGNAQEWVEDCYHASHQDAPRDGAAYLAGGCARRVAKGGSFADTAEDLRVAKRAPVKPEDRLPHLGFRLVRRLAPGDPA